MTASNELQKLQYDLMLAHAGLAALVGTGIYDRVPDYAALPYVSFGPSDVVEEDVDCVPGRRVTQQIDCWSDYAGGFKQVKDMTDQVKDALHLTTAELTVNALVEMRVTAMRHLRDPDGLTSHGVVTVESMIEEN